MVTELTSEPADLASAGSPSSSGGRPRVGPVAAYVAIVTAAAAGVTAAVLWAQLPRIDWLSGPMATCYLFALLLVVGELRPLGVARKDGDIDQITVSSTWAGALVLAGPLAFVLLAQGLAVAVDDLLRRRGLLRCCFNVGQYVLTLGAARWAFCAASGRPYLELTGAFDARDIGPAVVAGVVFFVVNNGTVAVAVALNQGLGVLDVLREDVRVQGLTSSILLGLAPVAVVVAHFSVWMLPLLVLPLVGVQHSAWLAARRQHEALHDALTGLPNRVLFHRRTDRAIVEGTALGGDVAVMLLDLDHFKEVNDTLGHHVGDDLLRQVAHRVSTGLPDGVTLARLGGDEFAVLVPAQDRLEEVLAIAHGIAERLREPVLADGVRVSVQASIGIAHEAADRATRDLLLQHADIALYRAKEDRGDIQVYRPEIDQHDRQRLSLVGDMHAGIEADQFRLVYQPQVDTRTGQVVGVEALMRWRHPEQGEIPPDVFIPLAENSGAIGALTRRALAEATATLALLHEAGHDIELAVNLSARLLTDLELPRTVQQAVRRHGVPASSLTIEVTESTIAADPRRAMEVLRDLRETGIRVSVDDFGTGYSSLSYLRRLNPDELKVDRSFVKHMRTDENSAVIVRSTVELGHGLGLSVVAEGVEDAQTFAALQQLGCDRIQGFLVARPMSLAALKVWLDTASVAGWQAVAGTPDDAPADGQVASVRVLPLQRRAS